MEKTMSTISKINKSLLRFGMLCIGLVSLVPSYAAIVSKTTTATPACRSDDLTPEQKDKVMSFVNKALADITVKGLEQAKKDFSDKSSGFITDDLYIFVLDDKQNLLANGAFPQLVGKNAKTLSPQFYKVTLKLYAKGEHGGGWVDYFWKNPKTQVMQCKSAWVTPLTKSETGQLFYLGTGLYH